MKVQLLTSVAGRKDGRQYSYEAGSIVDIDDSTAKRMIEKHRAVAIEDPKKSSTTKDKKDAE